MSIGVPGRGLLPRLGFKKPAHVHVWRFKGMSFEPGDGSLEAQFKCRCGTYLARSWNRG